MNICFTGHRPKNINMGGYDYSSPKNLLIRGAIMKKLRETINIDSYEKEYKLFLGGALGVDQMAFNISFSLKKELEDMGINIKLILCMPFSHQSDNWFPESKRELEREQTLADQVVLVDTIADYHIPHIKNGIYHPLKMQKRNEFMVDNSSKVIAIWDGSKKGGTYNCLRYAKSKNKEIYLIDPRIADCY